MAEIEFEHPNGNYQGDEDAEPCTETIEFDVGYEPADRNYGADADGNRGMYVAGYAYADSNAPEKCEECGHFYTEEERTQIEKAMQDKADTLEADASEPDIEPDYPDYD